MKHVFTTLLFGAALVGLAAPASAADPVCSKHIDKFKNLTKGGPMLAFWKSCQNNDEMRCKAVRDVLSGKPADATAQEMAKTTLHWMWPEGKKHASFCIAKSGRGRGDQALWAATALDSPGLVDHLMKMLEKDEYTRTVTCESGGPSLTSIFKAFFLLNAQKSAAKMVHLLEHKAWHAKCDKGSFAAAIPSLHAWNLDQGLKDRIVKLCVNEVLPNLTPRLQGTNPLAKFRGTNKEDQAACVRFIGMNNIKDVAAQTHIAYRAQPKNYSAGDAYLMLSRLDPKKWKNHLLKPMLRAKAVRRKGVQYRDYDEAISAAVGLNAIGDKEAKAAVAYWLGGEKGGYYNSESGFMKLFMAAATAWGTPGAKKLMKPLKGALKGILARFNKGDNKARANMVGTAAAAMLQLGDKGAMKAAKAVLDNTDSQGREALLQGLGGHPKGSQHFQSQWYFGSGGVNVGKGGLSVKDAQKLLKMLQSKVPMFSDRTQRPMLANAILNLRARIKAAGGK